MEEILINKKLRWIELKNPNEKTLEAIEKEFNIHPIIVDELRSPSDRSRAEMYDDYIFFVYHIPMYNSDDRTSRKAEIDFIATKNTLITVTYENVEPLEQFRKDLEHKLKEKIQNTGEMIYYIIQETHQFSLRELKHVERKVNFVGDRLFTNHSRKLLEEISYVRRDLLDFAIIAVPQKTTLESLVRLSDTFWGKQMKIYFADLVGDFMKVHYLLENLKGTIESYSETISQLFQFKTSEVIRRFSILGFLTFPLLLYATITLQPQIESNLITSPADFWFFFALIGICVVAIAMFFRKKGWL